MLAHSALLQLSSELGKQKLRSEKTTCGQDPAGSMERKNVVEEAGHDALL